MRLRYFVAAGIAALAGSGVLLPAAVGADQKTTTVNVIAGKPSEFRFTLSTKTVPHGTVTFRLTNGGAIPHDLKICASPKGGLANACTGKGTKLIVPSPSQSTTLTYTFKRKGTYEYLCTVPGHAAAGMKGDLKVT